MSLKQSNSSGDGKAAQLSMTASNASQGLYGFTRRQVDRLAPPASRQKAYQQTREFASERPLLFALVVVQILFALVPALLFITFVGSTALLAIGITLVATGSALLFTLFWTGLATALLAGTLLVTGSAGIWAWAWGVSSYLAVFWVYGALQEGFVGENTHETTVSNTPGSNNDDSSLGNGVRKVMKIEDSDGHRSAARYQEQQPTQRD
ncbi:hypothetical protein B0T22DRAFT_443202 [Podospora appendiculata]|uniref:Promethin n=1 Tax=Podospora appendiculata TaxID=314037 RepID=A0AAE1CB19_9PEZI|nr:hypothetical protein B0T22DRAFT_443202 [Podospora appendiculata]